MAAETKIEWTDSTWSPWWGCTKVSAGCTNCYAEALDRRTKGGGGHWGAGAPRRVMSDTHWRQPVKWNRAALAAGVRRRVFPSMCDPFDVEAPASERARFFELIEQTRDLDWLLLTKRPELILEMIPARWRSAFPANAWVGTSVENQAAADVRVPELLAVPASLLFLSCEPMLGSVNLRGFPFSGGYRVDALTGRTHGYDIRGARFQGAVRTNRIGWVIAGGESGFGARPLHPEWVRSLRNQCQDARVPFLFKQWGEWRPAPKQMTAIRPFSCAGFVSEIGTVQTSSGIPARFTVAYPSDSRDDVGLVDILDRVGKKRAGRELDGRVYDEMPEVPCPF